MTDEKQLEEALDVALREAIRMPVSLNVALCMLELEDQPFAGLSEIANAVAIDPELCERLIKAANSPLYTVRRKADNVRQALNLLGFNTAIVLSLSFSLRPSASHNYIYNRGYWRRSMTAAISALALAEQVDDKNKEHIFLAALMQDIGMLLLDQVEANRYAALRDAVQSHADLVRLERHTLGYDHALLGSRLLQHWKIQEPLWRAVQVSHEYHDTDRLPSASVLQRCVCLSGPIADYWLGQTPEDDDLLQLAQWANENCGLDASAFQATMKRIACLFPHYAVLYEVNLPGEKDAADLLARMHDIFKQKKTGVRSEAIADTSRSGATESSTDQVLLHRELDGPAHRPSDRKDMKRVLDREIVAARKGNWPLTVGLLGVDHFDRINVDHGRETGDLVLDAIATTLFESLRSTDMVSRYGGDELVILLPGTDESDAIKLFERLRRLIGSTHFPVNETELSVSVSIGLATLGGVVPHDDGLKTCDDMLNASRNALSRAKKMGRDRVVAYDHADPLP